MRSVSFSSFFLFLLAAFITADAKIEGFYKDVFQDQGTQISGPNMKVNCDYIGYSMEHLNTQSDKELQARVMIKNTNDDNGYLLYPDGAPRFAIIYYHGGYMGHSTDLGAEGRDRVREHYRNGGSQFGSCAGSYMLSSSNTNYFRIWPGRMNGPNVSNTRIDKIINAGSPFINYMDFKAGDVITGVYHNNGSSVDTNNSVRGTLFCAMHNSGNLRGYADIWAWKDHDSTGRVLGITGHPEGNSADAQKRYMGACMLYITDCLGAPRIKHRINNDQTITMDKRTGDNMPAHTRIGDKQYHHFTLNCETARNCVISVTGESGFDFHLFLAKDTFAFRQKALHADTAAGHAKTLVVQDLEKGTWHVGVKLNTTVTTESATGFPRYTGKLEVLNGIAYTINARWENTGIHAMSQDQIRRQIAITVMNKKNVVINTGKLPAENIAMYTMQGRLCGEIKTAREKTVYHWNAPGAGMYVVRLGFGGGLYHSQRLTIVK